MSSRERTFVRAYGDLIDKELMKEIIANHLDYDALADYDLNENELADVFTSVAYTFLIANQFSKFMGLYYK